MYARRTAPIVSVPLISSSGLFEISWTRLNGSLCGGSSVNCGAKLSSVVVSPVFMMTGGTADEILVRGSVVARSLDISSAPAAGTPKNTDETIRTKMATNNIESAQARNDPTRTRLFEVAESEDSAPTTRPNTIMTMVMPRTVHGLKPRIHPRTNAAPAKTRTPPATNIVCFGAIFAAHAKKPPGPKSSDGGDCLIILGLLAIASIHHS